MSRKPAPKPDDPEQSKRFIETAEEVGADTDDKALERAFKRISVSKGPLKVRHDQPDQVQSPSRQSRDGEGSQ